MNQTAANRTSDIMHRLGDKATRAPFRDHLPACGFLKSGQDQTSCNCAALLSAMDARDAPASRRTFKLEITLGNDAMHSVDDVEAALRNLVDNGRLSRYVPGGRSMVPDDGGVFDRNGNQVGKWEVTDDQPKATRPHGFKNDYLLTAADSKRISCTTPGCEKPATVGQNNGEAPFWYHCNEHAAEQRTR